MSVANSARSSRASSARRPSSNIEQQQQPPTLQSSPTSTMAMKKNTNIVDDGTKSVLSEVSASSSVGWSGDYCKKMMALNWDYTCGPLRVVQVGPHNHHWARLHAPGYAVLPRADGTLQHFRENHKHVSDAELLRQVVSSGVGKLKRDPKDKLLAPVQKSIRDDDIDALKNRLTKSTVTLPPARPPQTDFTIGFKHHDDASSIFSVSNVGSSSNNNNYGSLRRAASSSARGFASMQQPKETASSVSSARPSSRQQFNKVSSELSQARSDKQSAASELARAKEKLAAIEQIVEEHETSQRRASTGAGTPVPARNPAAALSSSSCNTSALSRNAISLLQSELEKKRMPPRKNKNNNNNGENLDASQTMNYNNKPVLGLNQREVTCNLNVTRRAVNPFC